MLFSSLVSLFPVPVLRRMRGRRDESTEFVDRWINRSQCLVLEGRGYADQNGHPYRSIGKILIERGEIAREDISLFTIRDWLRGHPEQALDLLYSNGSYVFFHLRENGEEHARGSLNVPLTPGRSIAVDRGRIPLGTPVWLDTSYPGPEASPLQRLVLAQDTGGAIKGYARADLFWGQGEQAERLAGEMKQEAEFYILLPKP